MNKALLIGAILLLVLSGPARAERMEGGKKGITSSPGTLLVPQLSALYPLMDKTAGLMKKATNLAGTGLNTDQWNRMSAILMDISDVLDEMARMMSRGYVVRQEKEAVERKIDDIEDRLDGLERYRRP